MAEAGLSQWLRALECPGRRPPSAQSWEDLAGGVGAVLVHRETGSPTVWGLRLKSRAQQTLRLWVEPLPVSGPRAGHRGTSGLAAASLWTLPVGTGPPPSWVSASSSYENTVILYSRAAPAVLTLVTPAKTLLPNQGTLAGPGGWDLTRLLGDTAQPVAGP